MEGGWEGREGGEWGEQFDSKFITFLILAPSTNTSKHNITTFQLLLLTNHTSSHTGREKDLNQPYLALTPPVPSVSEWYSHSHSVALIRSTNLAASV